MTKRFGPSRPGEEAAGTEVPSGRPGSASVRLVTFAILLASLSVLLAAWDGDRGEGRRPECPDLRRADSLVRRAVEGGRTAGAVLLVRRDGRTLLHRAYGHSLLYRWEDPGAGSMAYPPTPELLPDPVPMTPGTVFDLASVTKVMATTMAVMLLVDRGDVVLDAPVRAYLPDFQGPSRDSITVRHLLTHTSGLPQWLPLYYDAVSPEAAYARIRELPLEWGVGEGRHYSDLGFMLLGHVVEAVAEAPLERFLAGELYDPLGLASLTFRPDEGPIAATSHGNPYERRMVYDSAFGYRIPGDPTRWDEWRTRTLVGEVNDGNAHHAYQGVAGHAGLFGTARELAVLLDLLLNRGTLNGNRFLEEETVRRFLSPRVSGRTLGWQVPAWAPVGSFSHSGFTGTFVLGVPEVDGPGDGGVALVLLTNRQNMGTGSDGRYADLGPLQEGVARAVLGLPSPPGPSGGNLRMEVRTKPPQARSTVGPAAARHPPRSVPSASRDCFVP